MRSPRIHFLIALVFALAMVAGYSGWYATISKESSAVAELQKQITTESENVNRIASARTALSQIAGDEANVQSYFVSEAGVVTFINSLEARGLAQKTTVSVLSVSKGGSVSAPTLLISLTINGTFDAVMRTVGAIEYAPYTVSIETLGVQLDAKDSWHADLSLVVGSISAPVATSTP